MTDQELMQQALDALEVEHSAIYGTSQTAKAIKALRARLAQPNEPDWSAAGFGKPSKREWVGLTVEEIEAAGKESRKSNLLLPYSFARAIEAKLKEKNT